MNQLTKSQMRNQTKGKMKMRNRYVQLALLTAALLQFGVTAEAQVVTKTSAVAPSETPIGDVGKRIWDGYYNAEVHARYHLNRAAEMAADVSRARTTGIMLVLLGFAVPMVAINAIPKEWMQTWWAQLVSGAISATLLVIGIWDFVDAPYGKAEMHEMLAREWRQVSNEWQTALGVREAESPENLTALYHRLKDKQSHAEGLEPPELYEVEGLRRAQREFNEFLGVSKPETPISADVASQGA